MKKTTDPLDEDHAVRRAESIRAMQQDQDDMKTNPAQPKHTLEPWVINSRASMLIESVNGRGIAATGGHTSNKVDTTPENLANTSRIITCVNALAGVTDPADALEQVREALEPFAKMPFDELIQGQRHPSTIVYSINGIGFTGEDVLKARAALLLLPAPKEEA